MKGKNLFLSVAILAAGFPSACSFLSDLMHMDAPGIRFFHPEKEYLLPEEIDEIRVGFSAEMRRAVTEGAFSLRRDSTPVPGTFSWRDSGKTLVFLPLAPPQARSSYTLFVSAAAEDRHGNSLGEEFSHTFHTRPETEIPRIVSVTPAPGSRLSSPREPVCFVFSEPMDGRETEAHFSLSPGLRGFFTWSGPSDSFTWTPLEDYKAGGDYRVTLGRDARDISGNPLAEEYSCRFYAPEKNFEAISVHTVSGGVLLTETPGGILFDSSLCIEKDEEFRVLFSGAAGREERNSAVSVIPNTPIAARWENDYTGLILSFPEGLAWNGIYELRVLKKPYRFRVNGEGSVPLGVSRVMYIEDTLSGSPVRQELIFARDYSFPSCSDAAFDIYISHGSGASVVIASFLSAFSAEPGAGCLDITLSRVEQGPALPPPLPAPGPGETVFRVHCEVLSLPAPGTLSLRLGTDLRDSRSNRLRETYTLTVNKP